MACRRTKQGANDYYDDNIDRFFEERNEEFIALIVKMAESYLENVEGDKTPSVVDFAEEMEEEFEFSLDYEWLDSEYESAIDDCADQKYEEERDRRMGL